MDYRRLNGKIVQSPWRPRWPSVDLRHDAPQTAGLRALPFSRPWEPNTRRDVWRDKGTTGGRIMEQDDGYRRKADYCLRMAQEASQADTQLEWLTLAQSWLELIRRRSDGSFDAEHVGRLTGQEQSKASH